MAEAWAQAELPMDSTFAEPLLQRIAHKVIFGHSQRFSAILLGMKDAEYARTVRGTKPNSWQRHFDVSTDTLLPI